MESVLRVRLLRKVGRKKIFEKDESCNDGFESSKILWPHHQLLELHISMGLEASSARTTIVELRKRLKKMRKT